MQNHQPRRIGFRQRQDIAFEVMGTKLDREFSFEEIQLLWHSFCGSQRRSQRSQCANAVKGTFTD